MTTTAELTDNVTRARELITVLQWVADNPELFPDGYSIYWTDLDAWFYGDDAKANVVKAMRAIRKRFPNGKITKDYDTSTFSTTLEIPDTRYQFVLRTARTNVCRKIETGETVTKTVRDYSQAPTKEIEEPVVQWECDPILEA